MSTPPWLESGIRTLTFSRLVDLSHTVSPSIPQWPGDPAVTFADVARLEEDGFFLRGFSMGEHSATHMNAPASFHPGGATIESYEPGALVAPTTVMDMSVHASANPDYALSVDDVNDWERVHGRVPDGSVILLHTGWQQKWGDPGRYLGTDGSGRPHFPGFGIDAARYLLSERGAAGLGIDTHGLEPGSTRGFPVNALVLERPRLALENVTNLHLLPPYGATIVVGILRLEGGSGSPVSVLAFVP